MTLTFPITIVHHENNTTTKKPEGVTRSEREINSMRHSKGQLNDSFVLLCVVNDAVRGTAL